MTKLIRDVFASFGSGKDRRGSDFSDFFSKPSSDKAKLIRQVLREANAEQRRVMEKI